MRWGGGWGEGGCSFVACLSHFTIDHASLSRRSTVPTRNRHLQRLGAHRVFSSVTWKICAYLIPFLFRGLWPTSIS